MVDPADRLDGEGSGDACVVNGEQVAPVRGLRAVLRVLFGRLEAKRVLKMERPATIRGMGEGESGEAADGFLLRQVHGEQGLRIADVP